MTSVTGGYLADGRMNEASIKVCAWMTVGTRELLQQVSEAGQLEPKSVTCCPFLLEAVGLGDVEQALANH